jgi:ribosome-binding protein aMBF1 (putative translation factor)
MIRLVLESNLDRATEFICEVCGSRRERQGICADLVSGDLQFAICAKCAAAGPQKTAKNLRERVKYLKLRAFKLEQLATALSRAKSGPLTRIFQAAAAIGTAGKEVR